MIAEALEAGQAGQPPGQLGAPDPFGGHHHDGVVAGHRADDVRQRGPVQGRGHHVGRTRRGAHHDQVGARTPPRPPSPPAPGGGGPRGRPAPWAARARRRPSRRRRPAPSPRRSPRGPGTRSPGWPPCRRRPAARPAGPGWSRRSARGTGSIRCWRCVFDSLTSGSTPAPATGAGPGRVHAVVGLSPNQRWPVRRSQRR